MYGGAGSCQLHRRSGTAVQAYGAQQLQRLPYKLLTYSLVVCVLTVEVELSTRQCPAVSTCCRCTPMRAPLHCAMPLQGRQKTHSTLTLEGQASRRMSAAHRNVDLHSVQ